MLFIIIIFGLPIVLAIYMLIRDGWVYYKRRQLAEEDWDSGKWGNGEYHKLYDYDTMMRKFWIWDINKLKK